MARKRLIDAYVLSDKVDESKYNNPHPPGMVRVNHRNEHDHFLRMILDAPTVDAVEVVRCKDCIHSRQGEWHTEKLICAHQSHMYSQVPFRMPPEHFCSHGERKENHVQSST